jgi:glycine dehydrogenase
MFRSYLGLGYHDTITPSVILRMVMENPGWYTPYTPYQAEIAQGRLESLLNFQTMVSDLTGMAIANASLLDEATAAAEAMTLLHRVAASGAASAPPRNVCLISDRCLPQTIDVLRSRAEPLGIDLRISPAQDMRVASDVFGILLQYPDESGLVQDLTALIARAHDAGALVAVGTDLLSLAVLTPPGEMGADVVFGNAQRFGVPLGYGGPTPPSLRRARPTSGRLPDASSASRRTSMGARRTEWPWRRESNISAAKRATSNICTAQALLANMAAMYAVYHGPEGLTAIAARIHTLAQVLTASSRRSASSKRTNTISTRSE